MLQFSSLNNNALLNYWQLVTNVYSEGYAGPDELGPFPALPTAMWPVSYKFALLLGFHTILRAHQQGATMATPLATTSGSADFGVKMTGGRAEEPAANSAQRNEDLASVEHLHS